jgi:hypothetical protein
VVSASQRFRRSLFNPITSFPLNPIPTINASILEFLHVFGLAIYTSLNKHFVYFTNRPISFPLNTFAIKLPLLGFNSLTAIFKAANTS